VALLVVGLLTSLAPGCGDDNGDDGTQTIPCLEFQASAVPVPDSVVATDGSSGECDRLFVDLIVTDVEDLFAANFRIQYPSDRVAFVSASGSGSVLTSGGVAVAVEADETAPGEVTIGITRLEPSLPGVDVVGGQRLIRLSFVRIGSSGGGALTFPAGELLGSSGPGAQPEPIPGIVWVGGTIAIVQT
jgi:hypothetical protein